MFQVESVGILHSRIGFVQEDLLRMPDHGAMEPQMRRMRLGRKAEQITWPRNDRLEKKTVQDHHDKIKLF